MRKVLFYTQNRWAFGRIHHTLCKELWKYGIYADLWDWRKEVKPAEVRMLNETYDLFVTTPEAVLNLHYNWGIPMEKIAAVAHGQWDMLLAKQENNGPDQFYPYLHKFGVVSNILKEKAAEFGVNVVPDVLTLGTTTKLFYKPHATKLERIGYAGSPDQKNAAGKDIKRGRLVKEVVNSMSEFRLVEHDFYDWMCMPAYYTNVDCIVVSSLEESAGLPSMEAACAGRLVFSTLVGYFGENTNGYVLPMEDFELQLGLKTGLKHYYENPQEFEKACKMTQEYAMEYFDWSKHIEKWVEFLS